MSAIVSYCIISRAGRNTIGTVTQTRNQAITGFPGIGLSSRNNSDTEKKVVQEESEEEEMEEEEEEAATEEGLAAEEGVPERKRPRLDSYD